MSGSQGGICHGPVQATLPDPCCLVALGSLEAADMASFEWNIAPIQVNVLFPGDT